MLGASRAAAAHTGADAITPPTPDTTGAATPTPPTDTDHTPQPRSYTVQPGDTLWDIAADHTGNPLRYKQIAANNQGRIEPDGRQFSDPDLIYPGWTLEIPDEEQPDAPPHPHTPPRQPNRRASPPPSTITPGPSHTTPTAAPSSTPDSTGPTHHDSASNGRITLPGGSLISTTLAAAISAALVAVAVMRWRRRYRPSVPGSDQASSGPPMPPLVDQIDTAVRTATDPHDAADQDQVDEADEASQAPGAGSDTPWPAGSSLDLLDGDHPIVLRGPDAPTAARGLFLAALTGRCSLIATRAFVDRLLGGADLTGLPGVRVADTLDEALSALDIHLIQAAGTDEPDDQHTSGASSQQGLILFATDVASARWPRLTGLISQPPLGAVVVPLHNDPDTHDTDSTPGHSDPETSPAGLDLVSLDDALTLIQALHPEPAPSQTTTPTPAHGQTQTESEPESAEHLPPASGLARVRLLGTPTILMPDGRPAEGLRDRAAAFLTYLAIHRRTGADIDELLDATGLSRVRRTSATQRLYTDISNLRNVLAAAAGDTSDNPRRYILRTHGRYHIDPTRVDIDLWNLQDAIHHATTATTPHQRIAALHTYTGNLSHGTDHLWAVEARETALTDALNAATALADHYTPTDPHQALRLLTTAIGWSPYAESLYQHAMRLHAQLDDPAAIRILYTTLATRLRGLDTTPSPQTRQLATTLIAHRPAQDPPPPATGPRHADQTPTPTP